MTLLSLLVWGHDAPKLSWHCLKHSDSPMGKERLGRQPKYRGWEHRLPFWRNLPGGVPQVLKEAASLSVRWPQPTNRLDQRWPPSPHGPLRALSCNWETGVSQYSFKTKTCVLLFKTQVESTIKRNHYTAFPSFPQSLEVFYFLFNILLSKEKTKFNIFTMNLIVLLFRLNATIRAFR